MRRLITIFTAGAIALTIAAVPAMAKQPAKSGPTIVDIAAADDGEFDTLTQLVVQLGLVDALSARGQLTVFAPTDAAFEASLGLTADTVDDAIAALGADTVTDIVLFHVARGARYATDVLDSSRIRMLNGDFAFVDAGEVTIDGAGIIATDIRATNGVIHVVDAVLIP
jgi:uncharacterized surface protein with fasciclin (FAS1) repeats